MTFAELSVGDPFEFRQSKDAFGVMSSGENGPFVKLGPRRYRHDPQKWSPAYIGHPPKRIILALKDTGIRIIPLEYKSRLQA